MKAIDGYTRTCGLIGNPVEHTLSPVIQNTLAELTDRKLCYVPFKVEEGLLEDAVQGAYALNLLGVNVTVPYKSEVLPYLREIDPLAETIGAVNTLVRTDGGFKGYNTDMPGLYRAMCADGVRIAGEKVLILGAGGVARAVAVLLAQKEAGEIVLLNRTLEKAQRVAREVNELAGRELAYAMTYQDHGRLSGEGRYLAVQATSVGMHPHDTDVVLEDSAFYRKIHTGYDLIFNPADTRFMQLVRAHGGKAYNGAKMLLYQGIIAYELWTGEEISGEQAEAVLAAMG
ncbi:MAG: shikimate dehydrogenase [Muribaculum sp.]|nr:shikimate dehydrogenase [Muribaculum sp.]